MPAGQLTAVDAASFILLALFVVFLGFLWMYRGELFYLGWLAYCAANGFAM